MKIFTQTFSSIPWANKIGSGIFFSRTNDMNDEISLIHWTEIDLYKHELSVNDYYHQIPVGDLHAMKIIQSHEILSMRKSPTILMRFSSSNDDTFEHQIIMINWVEFPWCWSWMIDQDILWFNW